MKLCTLIPFLAWAALLSGQQPPASDHLLSYDRPAEYFEESLVLGNGRIGASVFGGVGTDTIYLNDLTLWSGEPVVRNNNPTAHTHLPAIREALSREDYRLADSLQRGLQGPFSQSYAPLGTLLLEVESAGKLTKYSRRLDLANATASVTYRSGGTEFRREYFVSHPDSIFVIRLTADRPGAVDASLAFESLLPHSLRPVDGTLAIDGYAPYHAEPSYRGEMENAVRFDPDRGTRFSTRFRVQQQDGTVHFTDSTLQLRGCTEAVILVSIATSFNGFDKDPSTEGRDERAIAEAILRAATGKSHAALRERHLLDYVELYDRVELDLGPAGAPELATDARLQRYGEGKTDRGLEELYFNFGRYLLISSSRTPEVPANLQGLWNPYLRPPWSSNYTLNINVEENYWLAGPANLSELHEPLLGFIANVAETGAVTARTYYGSRGWTAAHNSDIWAMSNPVGDFGQGDPNWANWNMGGPWLATHLWEHYLFTKDSVYLRDEAFPLLEGSARFCLDWMVRDSKGHWITSPSTSPEAKFRTPDGYVGSTLYGATADLAMIREVFANYLSAAAELNLERALVGRVREAQADLNPYRVGERGNLQEWYYDWEDQDPRHRHQTHLFGLHPGHHISVEDTPELADAARVSLDIKGDETTGWSKGWRINLWARLRDGERAYRMYRTLLRYVPPVGARHGGTYPNLLDAHPPFQIDGNFGGAAAVIEMLMQSTEEEIRLLPALPAAWPDGSIRGIRARGGFEVSLEWSNRSLRRSTVRAVEAGRCRLIYGDRTISLDLGKGEERTIEW